MKLNFRATNNEVKYEVQLAGLQATRHVGVARVVIYSDSQLVTQQVAGNFEVNSDKLQLYREAYEKMKEDFKEVTVTKIPRANNQRADELAKMASSLTTWGVLPADLEEARLIRKRAYEYTLIGDQLYKLAFSIPLLKCLDMEEAEYALQEVHQGCSGNHIGGRMLARKGKSSGGRCSSQSIRYKKAPEVEQSHKGKSGQARQEVVSEKAEARDTR
ncbi:uncharacterized protein LOC122026484 [Zingiber officinale]|uniref:uncharacterized protein LOC122026484 n=1 Tax=Zingiber officinale TaxID=94328 RepID=UPI001C4B27FD|nr:uncharacterized protein LOC122026484 [Zingiber officinale]